MPFTISSGATEDPHYKIILKNMLNKFQNLCGNKAWTFISHTHIWIILFLIILVDSLSNRCKDFTRIQRKSGSLREGRSNDYSSLLLITDKRDACHRVHTHTHTGPKSTVLIAGYSLNPDKCLFAHKCFSLWLYLSACFQMVKSVLSIATW